MLQSKSEKKNITIITPLDKLKNLIAFEAWSGVLFLGLTIVYILGLSGHGGPVGKFLIFLIIPVLGSVGAWFVAGTLVIATVHLLAGGKWSIGGRVTQLAFWGIPLILAAWENGMHLRTFYWDVKAREAVGWIGLWFGRFLRLLVGEAALAVAILLLIVLTFVILKLSPKKVLHAIWVSLSNILRRRTVRISKATSEYTDDDPDEEDEELSIEREYFVDEPATEEKPAPAPEPNVAPGCQLDLELEASKPSKNYKLPSLKLLEPPSDPVVDDAYRETAAERIVKTLETFGIPCKVNDIISGPAVTRVEVVLGEGIRVKQVEGMEKDIAYALAAKQVRVEAPIPGKTAVGIEFPNSSVNIVRLRELLKSPAWKKSRAPLTMAIGKDLYNQPVFANLGKMPHLLVAGQTGSGKSVCLHSIIMSLLYRLTPDHLRLILIDPKMVEFGAYEGLPHLLTPVVNEIDDAVNSLRWAVQEMRGRYRRLKKAEARDIQSYNREVPADQRMPFIIIVIDEMSDLMAQEGYEIEACITSLTQLARAVGIHLILATQRPSVKIITGNIKANIPARIALNVASQIDSRTIIDRKGAERVLGNGDMLYKAIDGNTLIRAQGALVEIAEVRRVVAFLANQGTPEFDDDVTSSHVSARQKRDSGDAADILSKDKDIFRKALLIFLNEGQASASMLQTKLGMGYPRARRVVEQMEEMGLVGPKNGSKPRELMFAACREMLARIDGETIDDISPIENENNVDEILEVV